jgi:hypothetical protein
MTTGRHHIKRTVAKALVMYVRTYSLFISERLSTNVELMLYKALIRSVMTYACPTWEYMVDIDIAIPAEQSTPHCWKS